MTRPLKILCLHGYRQSGEQFRTKTGGFRKLFKKKCEYVFIDAPHFIPGSKYRWVKNPIDLKRKVFYAYARVAKMSQNGCDRDRSRD